MRQFAVVFASIWAAAWLPAAAPLNRTFTGIIYDNRCSDGVCATQCPVGKTPKYTLQTETDGWLLTDQKTPAGYVGKKVTITGHPAGINKLKIVSISPAVSPAT